MRPHRAGLACPAPCPPGPDSLRQVFLDLRRTSQTDPALLHLLRALGFQSNARGNGAGSQGRPWSPFGALFERQRSDQSSDRSFIKGVPADDSDCAIVRAIVQLAQALGMKVVAEGVETEPQRNFLMELGCDEFQGFLFAPALDALSFEERVRGRSERGNRPRLSLVVR